MKASSACEVVAVLDTPAELAVVHGAIQRLTDPVQGDAPGQAEMIARFYEQSREQFDPQLCIATGMVLHGERWKVDAQFGILVPDESFILAAARHVAEERNGFKRLANHMCGTTNAARIMLGFFETDRKWRNWDSVRA